MPLHSNTVLRYRVTGTPVPQGSKRVWKGASGAIHMKEDAGARHTTWRYELAAAARVAMNEAGLTTPLRGPIDITLVFMLHRPASHYGSGKNSERLVPSAPILPAKVPDVDKLTRAVFDSMTSIVWVDDSQVVKLLAYKVFVHKWEEEGVSVKVGVIEQTEEGE